MIESAALADRWRDRRNFDTSRSEDMKNLIVLSALMVAAAAAPAKELPGMLAAWLAGAEGRASIDIERVEVDGRTLEDVHVPLVMGGGLATVQQGSVSLAGKPVTINAALEPAASRWAIEVRAEELDLRAPGGDTAVSGGISVTGLRGGRIELAAGQLHLPGMTAHNVEASLRVVRSSVDDGALAGHLRGERLTVARGDARPALAMPDWLPATSAAVNVELEQLELGGVTLADVTLPVVTGSGAARVMNGLFRLGGGPVRIDAEYMQASEQSTLRITASDVALGDLNIIDILDEGAPTAVEIDLRAAGRTLDNLAGTLTGRIYIDIGPGYLSNDAIDQLSKSWLAIGLERFNPLADMGGRGELQCADIDLNFESGRADAPSGFAMRTSEVALIGGGVIDLAEGTITAELQPQVRKTPLVGSASVVKMVRIEGPLEAPRTQLETGGIINKGKSLGVSLLTLGASPLAFGIVQAGDSLFDWNVNADTACETFVRADDG
ncbi:MAG: hypothetical protein HKO62_14070 [Gammaproteobacteria bacterium]|nr:hypothetical protein [Gammaproteobacteria bacterium]NNM01877.1 hypothetical protein [Gammaproteobacteria bacterium]